MPESELRLVKHLAEFRPKDEVKLLPHDLRGIYVLYKLRRTRDRETYDVRYVGLAARGGIRGRLMSHARSERKGRLWSHFSAFEVWDNIRHEEIAANLGANAVASMSRRPERASGGPTAGQPAALGRDGR